jgi:hypothetical protein
MSYSPAFEAVLQIIAAFMIFVVGYLLLFLLVGFCVVIGKTVYEGAILVRSYSVRVHP